MGEHIPKPIKTGPATWLGFILMCLGMFMAIFDIQVVATSLPNIQEALSISQDAMSWIQIAEIIAIPLSGWTTRVLLIPAVFSAVFLLFPIRLHPVATTIAGIMAVLAPTVGPVVGGWITDTWSWHWLFLINVAPGVVAALATPMLLPRERPRLSDLAT